MTEVLSAEKAKKAVLAHDPSNRCEIYRGKYRIVWMPLNKHDYDNFGPSFDTEDAAWIDAASRLEVVEPLSTREEQVK